MPATYLYRRGDGNEGNYPRYLITLADSDNAYAALPALLANDYIAGKRVRRHIIANTEIDGEPEFGLSATVYEGPEGEQAFGAAWLTAELQPLSSDDEAYYRDSSMHAWDSLKAVLDSAAWRQYRAALKDKAA